MAKYRGGSYRGSTARGYGGSGRYISSSRGTLGSTRSGTSSRGNGRTYSANTRSFVAGKISGQYQAKGYSKAHAQYIGNKVVSKAGSTFRPGTGSRQSWTAGVVTGRNQGLHGYGQRRSTYIGNAVARKQSLRRTESVRQSATHVQARTSKLVNDLTRSKSSLRPTSKPHRLRPVSRVRFQTSLRATSNIGEPAAIHPRSKILGFDSSQPQTFRPDTTAKPESALPQSKIVGWGEVGANAQQVSSKIVRFDGASIGINSDEVTEAITGGEASEPH